MPKLKLKSAKRKEAEGQSHDSPIALASVHALQTSAIKHVPASLFLDGSLLDKMADEYLHDFKAHCATSHGDPPNWPQHLDVGTLCSGSEITGMALEALAASISRQELPTLQFNLRFTCESMLKKQEWLCKVTSKSCCCFCNITDLRNELAYCVHHQGLCYVPRVNLIVVGLSCKDISKMNIHSAKHRSIMQDPTSPGGAATTFTGLLGYLDAHGCDVLLGEEVEELADGDGNNGNISNFSIMSAELSNRNFELQALLVNNTDFGLPSRRKRIYFMGMFTCSRLLLFKNHAVAKIFDKVMMYFALCKRLPPNSDEVLLSKSHSLVEKEACRRIKQQQQQPQQHKEEGRGWVQTHLLTYKSHLLRWGSLRAPEAAADSAWWSKAECSHGFAIAIVKLNFLALALCDIALR